MLIVSSVFLFCLVDFLYVSCIYSGNHTEIKASFAIETYTQQTKQAESRPVTQAHRVHVKTAESSILQRQRAAVSMMSATGSQWDGWGVTRPLNICVAVSVPKTKHWPSSRLFSIFLPTHACRGLCRSGAFLNTEYINLHHTFFALN